MRALDDLRARGVVFEHDGATWLRATDFGDQRDRVLVKSDGSTTYLCNDLAYHRDKFDRGSGAPHRHLGRRPPRPGEVAAGRDGGARVPGGRARGAARSAGEADEGRRAGPDLQAHRQRHHARRHPRRGRSRRRPRSRSCCRASTPRRPSTSTSSPRSRWRTPSTTCSTRTRASRRSAGRPPSVGITRLPVLETSLAPLVHERELELLRALAAYPGVVAEAAELRAPHRVTTWVRDFAKSFHGFYRDCRVISDDAALTQARLWLAEACRLGLAGALAILGVHAPDEMSRLDDDGGVMSRDRCPTHADRPAAASRAAPPSTPTGTSHRRLRPRRARAASSARRSSCTTSSELRRACREYREAFGAGAVAYAGKAFLCTAMARAGRRGGAPPRRRHRRRAPRGAARPGSRPRASCSTATTSPTPSCGIALDAGVGRIVADSFDELDRSRRWSPRAPERRACWCGSRPGVEAHTHEYIETGADDSKFGFTVSNGSAARRRAARREVRRSRARRVPLPHRVADPRARVVRACRGRSSRSWPPTSPATRRHAGATRSTSAAGSACPTPPTTSTRRSIAEFGRESRARPSPTPVRDARARPRADAHGRAGPVDRGARGDHALHRRHHQGDPRRAHLRRGRRRHERQPAPGHLRRARTRPCLPARIAAPRPFVATVAGKHCEQGDLLVRDAHLPADVAVGDVLATPVTGAYGYSMASNYNWCRARRWCSSATARPGSWCGARRSTTRRRATCPSVRETDSHGRAGDGSGCSAAATWAARWCASSTTTPT